MKVDLSKYQTNKVYKLDNVTTGVNIERRHKVFIESNGINLSALLRDVINGLMADEVAERLKRKPKK